MPSSPPPPLPCSMLGGRCTCTHLSALQGRDHGRFVHHTPPCRVDQYRPVSHLVELLCAEDTARVLVQGEVEGDDVGPGEQVGQGRDVFAGKVGLGGDLAPIVVDYAHTERHELASHDLAWVSTAPYS